MLFKRERIIDAAFEVVQRVGVGRATMTEFARAARLSRPTVYRYFSTKHAVLAALVAREESRLVARVRSAVAPHPDLRAAVEAGALASLTWLREHPLLGSLLKAEPEALLPYLTVEAHPLIAAGRRAAQEIFGARVAGAPPALVRAAAECFARLMQSYAITPPADPVEEVARAIAELLAGSLGRPRDEALGPPAAG
ncbi:MAG: TetR family transcriptional regulator [Acidobacteria bacterium]|nr:TetR family transcriptional regulator [Acidobacteriota bacterium]